MPKRVAPSLLLWADSAPSLPAITAPAFAPPPSIASALGTLAKMMDGIDAGHSLGAARAPILLIVLAPSPPTPPIGMVDSAQGLSVRSVRGRVHQRLRLGWWDPVAMAPRRAPCLSRPN